MKPTTNIFFIILSACIVAAGAYWFFFMNVSNEAPVSQGAAQGAAQAQFQMLVSQLQPISLDPSIFTDPRFTSLHDLTTQISPESAGRVDPFAAVAGVSAP